MHLTCIMEKKCKISCEIPLYLKEWIESHDISQNALVTLGLRKLWLEEQQVATSTVINELKAFLEKPKLPF